MKPPRPIDPEAPVLVVDIGNSTMAVATWWKEDIRTPLSVDLRDAEAFGKAFDAHLETLAPSKPAAAVIASVVPEATERVRALVSEKLDLNALVVGDAIPLPIDVGVEDAAAIGVDRVCAAAATYERLQSACIVVDFGSAVTVDLVDDEGTLLGGAILPGLKMQLRALHEHAALLPDVALTVPDLPYGRNTSEAMQNGVCRGVAGAVRGLVEDYASSLNRWPQVVATGGDSLLLAPQCDFLDTIVQDLTLRGVGLAYSKYLVSIGA